MKIRTKSLRFRLTAALCLVAISFSLLEPVIVHTAVFASEADAAQKLYVSPNGDDSNDGTLEAPLQTLAKARDTVRGLNDNMDGDIIVYMRGGEYKLTETLVFNEEDSGSNGHHVVYRNYPGEKPVVSGGQRIEGWVEADGILQAEVAEDVKFRDLWINGNRADRARSESFKITSWNESERLINVPTSAITPWVGSLDPQLEIVVVQHWVRFYSRLDSFNQQENIVSLALMQEARNKVFNAQYPDKAANQSFHFENSRLYLDEPGEWLLDETEHRVYYIPREGETADGLNAQTGSIETFIDFKGANKDTRVTNIKISGITFEYTKYQYPIDKDHVVPGQAGLADGVYEGARRQPAAIQLEAADHIVLERNVIRHAGATAVDIRGSTRSNLLIGNAILDIGGNGIVEGWFSEDGAATTDPMLMSEGNVIRNNYLDGISLTSCGVAIVSGFTRNVLIEHNEITNADYSGISVGWGWTANDTSLKGNVVRNNNIYGVMKRLADGAAIYTLSKTPDSEISGNYIHDIDSSELASNYPVAAIYLDQATWGYEIFDNVLKRVGQTFYMNVVDDGSNDMHDNESQNQAIIANAGLLPEYWDIVPETDLDHAGGELTASGFGAYRISGTVSMAGGEGNAAASILKNGTSVWSGTASEAKAAYNVVIDVVPGDVITFAAEGSVVWQSQVKPEAYTPRLVFETVRFEGAKEEETKIDYRNRVMTVIAEPTVDIGMLDVTIKTPFGTTLERVGGDSTDYSKDVLYKVALAGGANNLDYADGIKVKYWKLKVLQDSTLLDIAGYNIQQQLANADNWATFGGTNETDRGGLTFSGGYTLYNGQVFTDELLEFNMKTTVNGWPSLVLRAQTSSSDPLGPGNDSYIVVIKPDGIELQRFNKGIRSVFYGNIGGSPSKFGDSIPNVAFDFASEHNLVQVGAMDVDGGVRLVMYVNGRLIFDCVDTDDDRLDGGGYFGTYQSGNVIKLGKAPSAVSLNGPISDSGHWQSSVDGGIKSTAHSITLKDGYAYYSAEKFGDGLLAFHMKTAASGWPSLVFRVQDSSKDPIGPGNEGYIVVIKPEGIELQRFNDGNRTVFYGNVGGAPGKFGDGIPNTAFNFGSEHNRIELGAINVDGGVRLVMSINGQLIFDCVDTDDDRIEEAGYFGTYQASNEIKLSKMPVAISLNDPIGDADNWKVYGNGTKTKTEKGLVFNDGYAYYSAAKYGEELLSFNLKTTRNGWPSVVFRVKNDNTDPIGPGNEGYIVVIKPEGIELQRFNNGNRTVFYGNIGGAEGLLGDSIPNTAFDYESDHNLIQLGAINGDDGVRLVMNINGQPIFDFVDTSEERIEEEGYFGTYQAGNEMKLSRSFLTGGSEGVDARPLLLVELAKAEQLLGNAPIGDGPGQYPLWSKGYLELVSADTEDLHNDSNAAQAALQAGLARLKNAIAVFGQAQNTNVNAALNQPAASSEGERILVGFGPDKAVDGIIDFANGWSAESAVWPVDERVTPWLTVDLGESRVIDAVEVFARPNGNYDGERKTFQILASNDPAFTEGSYAVLGGVDMPPFEGDSWKLELTDDTAYRYIRYAKTNADYAFVSELMVYASKQPETYSVGGTVRDERGRAMGGADVKLYAFANPNDPVGTATTAEDGSYTIFGKQKAGKYLLKASEEDGVETVQVLYIPFADVANADLTLSRITIQPVRFTDGEDNTVDRLIASSFLQVGVTVSNFSPQPQNTGLILVLYAPSGRVADLHYVEEEIPARTEVMLQTGLTLPDRLDGYYAKVFIWDGLESMQPLTDATLFPQGGDR